MLAFLPFGAPLLALLPKAVLGGLVACAVLPLMRPPEALLITSRPSGSEWPLRDLFLGWATLAVTLAASPHLEFGLETGLGLAVALAAWQVLDRAAMAALKSAADTNTPIFDIE